MQKLYITGAFSEKLIEVRRILSQKGLIGLVKAIFAYLNYHLISKWHFVYIEFPLQRPIFSFDVKEPLLVRIATPDDMDRIKAEIFPALEGDLSYDKRYFRSLDQPDIKCFLAEKDGKLVHYSWVFMDASSSLLMDVPFDKRNLRQGDAFIGPVFTTPTARGLVYLHVLSVILHYLQSNECARRALGFVDGRNTAAVSFYKRLGFTEIVDAQRSSMYYFLWHRLGNALHRN
jgi:GNAT superfamily N-acetyltransferase